METETKNYGYLRVSTEDQNLGVDAQKTAIERQVVIDEWFEEHASGKDMTGRPVFTDLLDRACQEQACLVVSKLDRLGRSVVDVLGVFKRVKDCGASIKVLDMGIDTNTPAGKLMLTILAGFAEFEREMISQRTKDALAAAKAKGTVLGRPKGSGNLALEDLSWYTLLTYRSRAKTEGDMQRLSAINTEIRKRSGEDQE